MKKILALVVLVCVVLSATVALAAYPSKTVQNLTTVEVEAAVNGAELEDVFSIFVTDPSTKIKEEVKLITKHVETEPVATYYPEKQQEKLAELFEVPAELVAYELVPVACKNYKAEYGDVTALFTFATPFAEGTELAVAIMTEGWTVQKCVVKEGKVSVLFLGEELT